MKGIIIFVTVLLVSNTGLLEANLDDPCEVVQYLFLGKKGVIQCSFQTFLGISWYNSEEKRVILFYRPDGRKTGEGFDSGEYDIYPNGSLLLRNVTVDHEGIFTVTKVISTDGSTARYDIQVNVIVKPTTSYPVIEECTDGLLSCLISVTSDGQIRCHVARSRPSVNLTWISKNRENDIILPSRYSSSSQDNITFTSQTTVAYSVKKLPLLSVFICQVSSIPNDLVLERESVILLDKVFNYTEAVSINEVHVEVNAGIKLPCSYETIGAIVWKQLLNKQGSWYTLLHTIPFSNNFTEYYSTGIDVDSTGSLVLGFAKTEQEGLYACIHQDDQKEDIALYDVKVYGNPVPAYPVVNGCNHQQYCVLYVTNGDFLNCSIFGIRPEVTLEWKALNNAGKVSFENQRHSILQDGDRFDVFLTSRVSFSSSSGNRITVECAVTKSHNNIFKLSTKMDLVFEYVYMNNQSALSISVILSLVAVVIVVVVIIVYLLRRRVNQRKRVRRENDGEDEETWPMVQNVNESSHPQREILEEEKEKMFIDQLKTKYAILYDSVQPIPYIKDRMYCVDKVYVEGGIELLTDVTKQIWKTLNSYHELLTPTCLSSKRQIIEGEPGYGKSTLVLQVVYDWCNNSSLSELGDVDVIIYLRLRQLSGVKSISEAIKRFILPKDTRLSEEDIKVILAKVKKILILLDGYDEYPDQDNSESFVHHILRKELFQDAWVILSTRNSCFPKKMSPNTSRARLTGFNEEARDTYITKAITGKNKEATEKIKRKLLENPVLGDLCDVPLFFVMFAHMTNENKDLMNFKSVTGFFACMIECFHSHMRNKMADEDVSQFDVFEKDHKMLDKIAFDGLNRESQKIVWEREILTKELGEEFYNQYVRVGILVEEEVLYIAEGVIVPRYKWEVRFYHKLFCEWYAANYLSEVLITISDLRSVLKYLDPFDLQYLFLFTCGLNKRASNIVIKLLQLRKHTEKFAVLCMFEQGSNHEVFLEQVQDLVSTTSTSINMHDTKLLQRATIQILEIACKNKIKINFLVLEMSFRETESGDIILMSGIGLPSLPTLEKMEIRAEEGTDITQKNVLGLISYGSNCTNLKAMEFSNFTLRSSYPPREIAASLKSNSFDVYWCTMDLMFQLNFQSGQWEMDYINSLRHICSKFVYINEDENIMQQSSTIQLLKLASDQNIPILYVILNKCFDKVDKDGIKLKSGLTLPKFMTTTWLAIQTEKGRNLKAEDVIKIVTYGAAAQTLEKIWFRDCILPTNVPPESIPDPLIERDVNVLQCSSGNNKKLNFETGYWQDIFEGADAVPRLEEQKGAIFIQEVAE